MQPQPAFDTHAFVKRLTQAGMPEDQAEVLANGQSDLYERLVTKEYFQFTLNHELEKLRAELKHDIEKVQANLEKVQANLEQGQAELKHDIEKVRAELKHDIEKLRAELKLDIEKLRADLEHKFNQQEAAIRKQEAAIREMEHKLTIKLGSIVVIGITVLSLLDKLF